MCGAWIGLTDQDSEGTWVTAGNKEAQKFFNWNGKPNGGKGANCAKMLTSGKWSDDSCDGEGNYGYGYGNHVCSLKSNI